MKAMFHALSIGAIGVCGLALFAGCEVRAQGPEVWVPPPPGFVSVDVVGSDGFHHHGYYDDHHVWHGAYYDANHVRHDDPGDWHR